jgi:RNA polymerase sigma-70 factor (family 1)
MPKKIVIIVRNQFIKTIKNPTNYSDQELISLWQEGDDSAFEILYKKYNIQLITIALQKTNDRETAKELVQNTFITLFKNKDSAHRIGSLMAYLYTILKNRILDQHRHDLIHKKYEDYATYYNAEKYQADAHTYIETKELERLLKDEIKKLPPQCENVFRLRREHDLSNREIALQLNISVKTVEQHMSKALRLLKVAFQIGQKTLLLLVLIFVKG